LAIQPKLPTMVARRWRVVVNRARRHNRAAISRFDDNRRAAGVVGAEKRGILFRISGNDIRLFHQPRFKPGDLRRFAPQGQFLTGLPENSAAVSARTEVSWLCDR
jgi:hypothetical protein